MPGLLLSLFVGAALQMPLSVATTDDALAVFANPAGLSRARQFDFYYMYNFEKGVFWGNNGFVANLGPLGGFWEPGNRYGVALGLGKGNLGSGIRVVRDSLTRCGIGAMWRPLRWISLGGVWNDLNHDWGSVMLGAGARPLGNRLSFSADVQATDLSNPVIGIETEPFDGIVLGARVKPKDWSFMAGITFGLGKVSVGAVGTCLRHNSIDQAGVFVRAGKEIRRSLIPPKPRFLEIKLSGSLVDLKPGFSLSGSRPTRTTWQLLDLVKQARDDKSIAGIVLKLEGFRMGFAQAQELRAALEAFKAKGKKVYVYGPSLGMLSFYIASAADKIVCHPVGDVNIPGVSIQSMFLKGTLEKLGLEFAGQRHGKYKSAVEQFTEDSLTEPNREQLEALLDVIYDEFLKGASAGRGMSRESLGLLVDHGFFMAHEAIAQGLIDTTCYEDELEDLLKQEVPGFRKVTEKKYLGQDEFCYDWHGRHLVAVIYASGSIASGESRTDFLTGSMTMGAKTIVRAIRAARRDKRVKAIVLRVDSPGGSGFASDLIWHELELAKKKKPVVVSMGNVAASGGYYISCNADRVYANPGTITGSIGGFSFKFVTEGFYNKLGAKRQVLKRGEHADAGSDVRGFTSEEDSIFQSQVDYFCRKFVQKVADGRGLSFEAVDSVAQGRVWAGRDAYEVGLVDSLGGLLTAIEWAKHQAKLKVCDFVFYPKPKTGLKAMLGKFLSAQIRN
ncbi:signal peptide peptidase SppA [candidate division WOR-3 bacterium JGI_Cruoil_03_51_56]|mgnify:CR=1 FL=1|uniref:Signal peptide peptidase SppA n=1 Tax=candidate division WOR-3 bacterium JGI_Cruoil_03_51_56 TaxID=1973747 RepID=A0A235BR89_UNCW3|nr:MAG: signal peptide peptidase SppA [candidate division WOR-3 bacterium JGI_Cruoil_03_51_56]